MDNRYERKERHWNPGAKLTGKGGGGNVVAISDKVETQKLIANSIEGAGYRVCKTKVGATL